MTRFRCRQWGTADWTEIDVVGSGEEDDVVEDAVCSIIGSALETSSLHIQRWNDDEGEWEDME